MPQSPPASPFANAPELVAILRDAAEPLLPSARPRFFERVLELLRDERQLAAGAVSRACRKAQAEFVSRSQ